MVKTKQSGELREYQIDRWSCLCWRTSTRHLPSYCRHNVIYIVKFIILMGYSVKLFLTTSNGARSGIQDIFLWFGYRHATEGSEIHQG